MRITVPVEFEDQRVTDLLTSALEGGSNYWYCIVKSKSHLVGREFIVDEPQYGGVLVITLFDSHHGPINGSDRWYLDWKACERGLVVMAQKYPQHFANFVAENDDAETGDVFLQCACFGELIFG